MLREAESLDDPIAGHTQCFGQLDHLLSGNNYQPIAGT